MQKKKTQCWWGNLVTGLRNLKKFSCSEILEHVNNLGFQKFEVLKKLQKRDLFLGKVDIYRVGGKILRWLFEGKIQNMAT